MFFVVEERSPTTRSPHESHSEKEKEQPITLHRMVTWMRPNLREARCARKDEADVASGEATYTRFTAIGDKWQSDSTIEMGQAYARVRRGHIEARAQVSRG
jgi:hypothetical protein